jgi:quercetin dioxygenase-like cupin family protein
MAARRQFGSHRKEVCHVSERYPPGIDVDILGRSIPMSDGRAALLIRVTYAPGSHIPPHTDPGIGVWAVERGRIGFAVQEGNAVITRSGSSRSEKLEAGSETVLNTGDTASYGPNNVHTSRNAGDVPATILIAGVYADEGSLVHPERPAATT